MKNKLFKVNYLILILFIAFFIYQNIIAVYLMRSEDIRLIYPTHHEIFYTRLIYYELEVSTYTHFTVKSVFKIIYNFIQAVGIVEILFLLFSIPVYLSKEKDNRISKLYISIYDTFLVKILLTIIAFLLAYLTYTIEISIAWLVIKIVFILSILYYLVIFTFCIKSLLD